MSRLNFITKEGQKVLWCDYSSLKEQEMIALLHEAAKLGKTSGQSLNILADFHKTPQSKDFNTDLKRLGKEYYKSGIEVKVAVLGINSPLKRVIVNATMAITRIRNVRLFDGKDQAMSWLIS